MAYCGKCGNELGEGAKFCSFCGSAVVAKPASHSSIRKEEYAGKIIKCPSCGEPLPSFAAVCPACKHEIITDNTSSAIASFIKQINECDSQIINSSETRKRSWGWQTWSVIKKISWVLLCILLLGIPLLFYALIAYWKNRKEPSLTQSEKYKTSLIENYYFLNERGPILEALLFIKSKMSLIFEEKLTANNYYWLRIWSLKAEALYERAQILFTDDAVANETIKEIRRYRDISTKKINIKRIVYLTVLILIVLFPIMLIIHNTARANEPLVIPNTALGLMLPKLDNKQGKIAHELNTSLSIQYYNVSQEEFEQYRMICIRDGFDIDVEESQLSYHAFNQAGYYLTARRFNSSSTLFLNIDEPEKMGFIDWPKHIIVEQLPTPKSNFGRIEWITNYGFVAYLGNTTYNDYKVYVDASIEMGFDRSIYQSDKHFRGKNLDGYEVQVDYNGFNTIFLRLDAPEQ